MKYETQIILDEKQVPHGFVPLSDFDVSSAEHKRLSEAHNSGSIRAVKVARTLGQVRNGRVWVSKEDADNFLAGNMTKRREQAKPTEQSAATAAQLHAAITALVRIDNGISLMQATLERLTAAVELIATQPRTPQQELLHAISSNGFDS